MKLIELANQLAKMKAYKLRLKEERDILRQQLAEAMKDAERYRFHRGLYVAQHNVTPEELDAATDAATGGQQ